jgi:hypothetical protein
MTFQSISVCPGMPWQPGAAWTAPIQKDSTGGEQDPNASAQRASSLGRLARAQSRRRARTDDGIFQADDPATPAVNEAYEGAPNLRADARPSREN